jgi:hypothetical protein
MAGTETKLLPGEPNTEINTAVFGLTSPKERNKHSYLPDRQNYF